MNKRGFVYIMTNKNRTTLYIGVTNDLCRRINEHKKHLIKNSFTYKYNLEYCIYFEEFPYFDLAIQREKELKKWNRQKKEELINKKNPQWNELATEHGFIRNEVSSVAPDENHPSNDIGNQCPSPNDTLHGDNEVPPCNTFDSTLVKQIPPCNTFDSTLVKQVPPCNTFDSTLVKQIPPCNTFDSTLVKQVPPFGRNDAPLVGENRGREGGSAALSPSPLPFKSARHSERSEESAVSNHPCHSNQSEESASSFNPCHSDCSEESASSDEKPRYQSGKTKTTEETNL